jgi:glycosyltransferase involved in cell wall biosynthesis
MIRKLKSIDIITSALNEEDCIFELYSRIEKSLESVNQLNWRLIICDNGSSDSTWSKIESLGVKDPRVLGVRMSRTFDLDSALTCGLDMSTAEAAVLMVSDLQDPPELIPDLIAQYELGFEQVLVRVSKRSSVPPLRRFLSRMYYKLAYSLTSGLIPQNISDFRLISNKVVQESRKLREKNRFLRGLIAWVGFESTVIEIERPPRFSGESKFSSISLTKAIFWALFSVFAHSSTPLVWISILGFCFSIFSVLGIIIFTTIWIAYGVPFAGYGSIMGFMSLGFSVVMVSLGIIAQYIALIYNEVKDRPLYIVSEYTESNSVK